jgi:hypothetical protein
MDFFQNINAMQVQGDWIICIRQNKPERMTVSVVFKNDNCGDAARKIVPPLVFSDKVATEIDGCFFADLNSVIPDTAKLFSSMEHYLKQREEAQKRSQMETGKIEQQKKQQVDKLKKYEEALKKVEELEKDGKFKQAWLKVPDPTDFPEHSDDLRKLKSSITEKFAPEIFANKEK